MKNIFLAFTILFSSNLAAAKVNTELCALSNREGYEHNFEELKSLDIKTATELNDVELYLINQHLQNLEYTDRELSLSEIQELFGDEGDFSSDDLVLTFFRSLKNRTIYIETKSWPGENPYGFIYKARGSKLSALSRDGTVYLIRWNKEIVCE